MDTRITIYTDNLTQDSLDPEATLSDDEFAAARERYIEMAVEAVESEFPTAEVETDNGNGLRSFDVYVDADDVETEIREIGRVEDLVRDTLEEVYELWCQAI